MSCKMWNEEELEFLKKNYKQMSYKELTKILNRSKSSIENKAHRLGLKKDDKYIYNRNFFKNIDTEEKAYWLGFIYADGYVNNNKSKRNYELGIEINKNDYLHLKKFNKSLCGNIEIVYRNRQSQIYKDKLIPVCHIRIYCKDMLLDLEKYGVVQNKHTVIKLPTNIDEDLIRHFIRGYFDGDGSITFQFSKSRNKYYPKCNITSSSLEILNNINDICKKKHIETYILKDRKTYKLCIRQKYINKFLEYIYGDSTIYLDRKYKNYLKCRS